MRQFLICFLILAFSGHFAIAQEDSSQNKPQKRPWYLTLGTDVKVKSIQGKYNYLYKGEYTPDGEGANWLWRERKIHINNVLEAPTKFYDIKMDALLSRNRSTKFGLSYNFGILDYSRDSIAKNPVTGADERYLKDQKNLSFIAITGLFEYAYYFNRNKVQNSPFVYGSLAAGFYRASEDNGGPGNEYFSEIRGGFGYHFNRDWLVKIWAAQNFLFYSEHQQSLIFDKEQTRNINMNLTYFGIGFAKQFELIPD